MISLIASLRVSIAHELHSRRENQAVVTYGSMPVVAFCKISKESREFLTDSRSFVLTNILGSATDISPGQTSLSLFAPSTTHELPLVIVALLYHVTVSGSEILSVLTILPRWTRALP